MSDPFSPPPAGAVASEFAQPLLPDTALAKNGEVVQLATLGQRFFDLLLTIVLIVVTLVIGYLVWALCIWGKGQSPAKQLLKLRVVRQDNGQTADFGKMFVRSFLVAGLLSSAASAVSFGIYGLVDIFTVFSKDRTRLTDKISGTYVAKA